MDKLNEHKRGFTVPALIYLIAGIILLACPEITTKTITFSIASIFVVIGAFQIIGYLRLEPNLASASTGFVNGTLLCLIGIFIFIKSEMVISIIPVILGFLIIVSGTLKIQHAINLFRIRVQGVKGIAIMGVINIIIGIITIFNPFQTVLVLMRVMGIGLIISGITDLMSSFYLSRKIKKYTKDVEEKCIEDKSL